MNDATAPTGGQVLYDVYLLVFGTVFAPTWPTLSETSRADWERFERAVTAMVESRKKGAALQDAEIDEDCR